MWYKMFFCPPDKIDLAAGSWASFSTAVEDGVEARPALKAQWQSCRLAVFFLHPAAFPRHEFLIGFCRH